MISNDPSLLHADFRSRVEDLIEHLGDHGMAFRIFEAFRSARRQGDLYAQGRTAPGPVVTKARPWSGFHQYGLAADLVIDVRGVNPWSVQRPYHLWWQQMHAAARSMGLRPLSFELCHVELATVSITEVRHGIYPPGGGDAWALNLSRAIDEYPEGAPPKPKAD